MAAEVRLDDIREARRRLDGAAIPTPIVPIPDADIVDGNRLWLKAENLQRTGSFKFRGAYSTVASLSDDERARGVITYSSGNHGQAVAAAAALLGVRAIVVTPEDVIGVKVDAIRRWGADVELAGFTTIDREVRALELAGEHGYTVIPPFDDPRIIAGQGTCGLEIVEQLPEVDAVVVPIGGGGLIAGILTAIKGARPDVTVIGVEPTGAADARDSLDQGTLVTWSRVATVADGLRAVRLGELNFEIIRRLVDDVVLVDDDQILAAVTFLARNVRLVAEPSGAVATAAILAGATGLQGKRVVALISGGNIEPSRLAACVGGEAAVTVGLS